MDEHWSKKQEVQGLFGNSSEMATVCKTFSLATSMLEDLQYKNSVLTTLKYILRHIVFFFLKNAPMRQFKISKKQKMTILQTKMEHNMTPPISMKLLPPK